MVTPDVMRMVDTEANYALEKIISGDETPWDEKMWSAWTRFILYLRFRNPEAVHEIKQQMQDVWRAGIDNLRANYDKRRCLPEFRSLQKFWIRFRVSLRPSSVTLDISQRTNLSPGRAVDEFNISSNKQLMAAKPHHKQFLPNSMRRDR
jgi:hypothetical protein